MSSLLTCRASGLASTAELATDTSCTSSVVKGVESRGSILLMMTTTVMIVVVALLVPAFLWGANWQGPWCAQLELRQPQQSLCSCAALRLPQPAAARLTGWRQRRRALQQLSPRRLR